MLPIIDALADFGNYYKSIIDWFFVWNLSNIEIEICKNKKKENYLVFTELFSAEPHVFLQKNHPLASKKVVSVHDLAPYPRLNFVQGEYESVYFSEELFSSIPVDKEI